MNSEIRVGSVQPELASQDVSWLLPANRVTLAVAALLPVEVAAYNGPLRFGIVCTDGLVRLLVAPRVMPEWITAIPATTVAVPATARCHVVVVDSQTAVVAASRFQPWPRHFMSATIDALRKVMATDPHRHNQRPGTGPSLNKLASAAVWEDQ
jgi:hypothetical protein